MVKWEDVTSKNTKVLMYGWEFPPHHSGGLGVACEGLTRALASRGYDITFVMPKKLDVGAPWARFLFMEGVAVKAVDSSLSAYATSRGYSEAGHDLGIYAPDLFGEVKRYALKGGELAHTEQFDIIYAHDWLSFGAGMEAKRISGKPLIVHVHATEFDRCGGRMGMNAEVYAIEHEGMMMADRVVAVSEYTKRIIVREYGIPEDKIRVVHNGIDETTGIGEINSRLRLATLKSSGYSIVLFLGRITLQKGPDYFLRAAREVLSRESRVVFFLSGSGDMERQVMDMAAALGISDRVLFTGFLRGHDRTEIYKAADLFVMPSVSEPFGITALEAMKSGTPVLLSKQSGAAEAVRHALKVDFWDVDEMANKILGVIRHKGLKESLSENGKDEASKHTWDAAALKVENIVQEMVV